ncbi:zinc knuckle CX2CX4HX4C containing protein [Tanacetum coccineum]
MRPAGFISNEAWRFSRIPELTPSLSRNAAFDFNRGENSREPTIPLSNLHSSPRNLHSKERSWIGKGANSLSYPIKDEDKSWRAHNLRQVQWQGGKIPSHFHDSIHDLNKKKGSNKTSGFNVMNKKDDACLDQASREGLEEHDSQGDGGEKMRGCNEVTKGIVLDSEVVNMQNEDDGIGVEGINGKVNFGSVNDDMIRMCDGTSKDIRSKKEGMQGVKMAEQGNEQEVNNGQNLTKSGDSFQNRGKAGRKSFVEVIAQNLFECDKTLESIPTEIDENGVEVVVFDDVMVAGGSKRKPLVVQKGSVDLNLDNTELERIPLWVKLCNVPLEAWTVKGISALASKLGKPLVMDSVTANKYKQGIGMVRYARVLIEVSAKKILANDMEIVYKNAEGKVQCKKSVKVEYDWKPQMCSECGVFGHTYSRFYKNVANINTKTKLEKENENVKGKANEVNTDQFKSNVQRDKSGGQMDDNDEGFVEVKRKKNIGIDNKVKRQNFRSNPQVSKVGNNSKTMYQAKTKEAKAPSKTPNKTPEKEVGNNDKEKIGSQGNSNKKWSVHKDILEAMKRSANKYSLPNGGEMEDGCRMFKTVKILKVLKKHLKQLAWCNGDVFENVKKLRESCERYPKED